MMGTSQWCLVQSWMPPKLCPVCPHGPTGSWKLSVAMDKGSITITPHTLSLCEDFPKIKLDIHIFCWRKGRKARGTRSGELGFLVWRNGGWGSISLPCRFLRWGMGQGCAELFSLVSRGRISLKVSAVDQKGFRLDSRKHFFTKRVLQHWNRLLRELDYALNKML